MCLAVCVLTCVAAGVMTSAFADPEANAPSATPAASAAPAPAAAPAATPAAATAPAAAHPAAAPAAAATEHPAVEVDAAQMDQLEKHLISEGYKVEMHNGEKLFCRREEQMGTRLGAQKQCASAQQLAFTEKDSRRQAEHAQHNQTSSPGGGMGK